LLLTVSVFSHSVVSILPAILNFDSLRFAIVVICDAYFGTLSKHYPQFFFALLIVISVTGTFNHVHAFLLKE